MRLTTIAGAFLITAATFTSVSAADFATGFVAAEKGDYKTALAVLGPLADQGNAQAQFNIGMLFHSGAGVPQNEREAVKWYERAAHNGYRQAQEYLAVAYQEGWFGLPKDAEKAAFWHKKLQQSF